MEPPILTFQGPYRFLSNFFIEPDGTNVEAEYQAMKCANPVDAAKFDGMLPWTAKKFGRSVQMRSDWNAVRKDVMRELVRQKFEDHEELRAALIATGDARLVEGNGWLDATWGVTRWGLGVGKNWLGEILMEVREELRCSNLSKP